MTLAAPTLLILVVIAEAAFAIQLLLVWNVRRNEQSLLWWAVGSLCGALGCLALVLRGEVSEAISITLGNVLIQLAWTFRWVGMRQFAAQPLRLAWVLALPLAVGLLFHFRDVLHLGFRERVLVISATISVTLALTVLDAWRAQRLERLQMRRVMMVSLALNIAYHLFRAIYALGGSLPESLLTPDQVYSMLLLVMITLNLMTQISCLTMVFERHEGRLIRAATVDGLTDLLNRPGFFPLAERQLRRNAQDAEPASVLVIDLDHFKRINDTHGHDAGDQVLRAFAGCLRAELRAADLIARSGGEEFWVLLPAAPSEQALEVAQRLCSKFAELEIHWQQAILRNSVSIGVTEIALPQETLQSALQRADTALYQAKREGRGRVVIAAAPVHGQRAAAPVPSQAAGGPSPGA